MLRRLLLGKPRNNEKESQCKTFDEDKNVPDALMESPTTKALQEKSQTKDDVSTSDPDTESSETEDSDTASIDTSGNDSFEECSGDLLEWKGFEMMRDERVQEGTQGSKKDHNKMIKDRVGRGDGEETEKRQENPFAYVFEIRETKVNTSNDDDNINSNINEHNSAKTYSDNDNDNTTTTNSNISSNNNNNNINNNNAKLNSNNNTGNNISNNNNNNNNNNNSDNNNNNEDNHSNDNAKIDNITEAYQTNDNNTVRPSNSTTSTPNIRKLSSVTKQTKNRNNNKTNTSDPRALSNSKQETNKKQIQNDNNQSKTSLKSPQPTSTNHSPPKPKANGISRHSSLPGNQRMTSIKRQTSDGMEITAGKGSKIVKDKPSTPGHKSIALDTKGQQGVVRGKMGPNKGQQRIGNASNVSVKDLEKILGVDVAELREVIKKFKSEQIGTTVDSQRQSDENKGNLGSSMAIEDHMIDSQKSESTRENDVTKECKGETMDNKDEISSDSGVSEPDAHSTDGQPSYISLKAIIKRKEYLEGQIRKLEDRMAVMKDHKKDIQFVHDVFDLYSDGLAKVERNNGGGACVENLKSILANQLREMEDEDMKAKLKALEDLGIPHFSKINARIDKLRKRMRHTVDDERKCRSKGVQKLRFEIGKVQGMCEAVLDCVYTE